MLGPLVPLQIAGGHPIAAFSPLQKNVLTYLSDQLQELGLLSSFLVWGLNEVLTGYLFYCSGFLPRILGILLSLCGFVYLIDPLLSFGAPAAANTLFPSSPHAVPPRGITACPLDRDSGKSHHTPGAVSHPVRRAIGPHRVRQVPRKYRVQALRSCESRGLRPGTL